MYPDARTRIGQSTWTVLHSYPYSSVRHQSCVEKYRRLVDIVFDMYPCEVCWHDMKRFRKSAFASLERAVDEARPLGDAHAVINNIVIWAFRFHNAVTRKIQEATETACATRTRTFLKLEVDFDNGAISRKDLLKRLDDLYNIVYDP